MTKIVDFALSKARTTLALALVVIIAGSYARSVMPVAADPNIQLPLVSVEVFLDGASPGDASRLIARPLEPAVGLGIQHTAWYRGRTPQDSTVRQGQYVVACSEVDSERNEIEQRI